MYHLRKLNILLDSSRPYNVPLGVETLKVHLSSQKPFCYTRRTTGSTLKAAFNSTCQYPDLKSNSEKYFAQIRVSIVSSICGSVYASLIMRLLSFLKSMQNLREPSFFLANTLLEEKGFSDGLIASTSNLSARYCLTYS